MKNTSTTHHFQGEEYYIRTEPKTNGKILVKSYYDAEDFVRDQNAEFEEIQCENTVEALYDALGEMTSDFWLTNIDDLQNDDGTFTIYQIDTAMFAHEKKLTREEALYWQNNKEQQTELELITLSKEKAEEFYEMNHIEEASYDQYLKKYVYKYVEMLTSTDGVNYDGLKHDISNFDKEIEYEEEYDDKRENALRAVRDLLYVLEDYDEYGNKDLIEQVENALDLLETL